jgi:hypothetical protein
MKQHVLLYAAGDIHARIKHIFGQPSRDDKRVALVAYVGADGEKYLPHPQGLRLICNPSPGGTDPDTLRRLLKRGARIELSDRLHMKVYWSKNRGCIITSANASSNALGKNGLKEAGIWLPSRAVDIHRLIRYASPRKLRERDLRQLDMQSREHNRNVSRIVGNPKHAQDFIEWYSSPHRSTWKISLIDEEVVGDAPPVKEQTKSEYGQKEPYTWVATRNTVRKNDWLLTSDSTMTGAKSVQWVYADFVVKLDRKEKRFYSRKFPYHAVQVNTPTKYPVPPFQITWRFRKALSAAIKLYTPDRLIAAQSDFPSEWFLKIVASQYSQARR